MKAKAPFLNIHSPTQKTLAWEPFLAQTLAMVRDRRHTYRRGPGYVEEKHGGGNKKDVREQYWEVDGDVPPGQEPAPYRVELVGVYVRPEVAVRRAIIRRLLTGRGVPVRDQLRSHALFARNFEAFACQFDTVRCEGREGGEGGVSIVVCSHSVADSHSL